MKWDICICALSIYFQIQKFLGAREWQHTQTKKKRQKKHPSTLNIILIKKSSNNINSILFFSSLVSDVIFLFALVLSMLFNANGFIWKLYYHHFLCAMPSTQRYIYIRTDFRIFTWANVNLNARNFWENGKKKEMHTWKEWRKKIVKQIMKCFHHNNNFILWMLLITFSSAYGLTVSFGRKENQFVFSWKLISKNTLAHS